MYLWVSSNFCFLIISALDKFSEVAHLRANETKLWRMRYSHPEVPLCGSVSIKCSNLRNIASLALELEGDEGQSRKINLTINGDQQVCNLL